MNTPDFEVGLSVRARRDLREIARYYADTVSESVANKNYDRLIEAMESLGTRPERYPPEPLLAQLVTIVCCAFASFPTKSSTRFRATPLLLCELFIPKEI